MDLNLLCFLILYSICYWISNLENQPSEMSFGTNGPQNFEKNGVIEPKNLITDEEGIKHLIKFNYLEERTGMSVLDSYYRKMEKKAVKLFQKKAGLKITGMLDKNTKLIMVEPRCGVPDFERPQITVYRRSKRYNLFSAQWGRQKNFTFSILNYLNDAVMSRQDVDQIITYAFNNWTQHADLSIERSYRKYVYDMGISFWSGYHQDPWKFDGPGGIVAHALLPPNGDIHFDKDEVWTTDLFSFRQISLFAVALHEIGHVLGLNHSDPEINSVMYSRYTSLHKLADDDIKGIQKIYGPKIKPRYDIVDLPPNTVMAGKLPPKEKPPNHKPVWPKKYPTTSTITSQMSTADKEFENWNDESITTIPRISNNANNNGVLTTEVNSRSNTVFVGKLPAKEKPPKHKPVWPTYSGNKKYTTTSTITSQMSTAGKESENQNFTSNDESITTIPRISNNPDNNDVLTTEVNSRSNTVIAGKLPAKENHPKHKPVWPTFPVSKKSTTTSTTTSQMFTADKESENQNITSNVESITAIPRMSNQAENNGVLTTEVLTYSTSVKMKIEQPIDCESLTVDAVTENKLGEALLFTGQYIYRTDKNGQVFRPDFINKDCPNCPNNIDAAIYLSPYHYIFKNEFVWKVKDGYVLNKSLISDVFQGLPSSIDSIFIYPHNKKVYATKYNVYYRLNEDRTQVDHGYPRDIVSNWFVNSQVKLHGIEAAFAWKSTELFFFEGDEYYLFDHKQYWPKISFHKNSTTYSRSIKDYWIKCDY